MHVDVDLCSREGTTNAITHYLQTLYAPPAENDLGHTKCHHTLLHIDINMLFAFYLPVFLAEL